MAAMNFQNFEVSTRNEILAVKIVPEAMQIVKYISDHHIGMHNNYNQPANQKLTFTSAPRK